MATFNARAETVTTKPVFHDAFKLLWMWIRDRLAQCKGEADAQINRKNGRLFGISWLT